MQGKHGCELVFVPLYDPEHNVTDMALVGDHNNRPDYEAFKNYQASEEYSLHDTLRVNDQLSIAVFASDAKKDPGSFGFP